VARLSTLDGDIIQAAEMQVEVSLDAPPTRRLRWAQPAQPTAAAMEALFPTLPVVDCGRDYVLFDLRGLNALR